MQLLSGEEITKNRNMENKIQIHNEQLKRIGFSPDALPELISYFEENPEVTLIINFGQLMCNYEDFKDFSVVKQINPQKLLIHSFPDKDCNVEACLLYTSRCV